MATETGYILGIARGHNAGACLLKDGEIVDGASSLEASYVVGQESLIVELLTSNPPTTNWDVEVPKQSFFVSLILSILPILLIIFLTLDFFNLMIF